MSPEINDRQEAPATPAPGDLRAEIPNPSMVNGELVGIFRVWSRGEDGQDTIELRKDRVRFQMTEVQQDLVKELTELGFPNPEVLLADLLRDARNRALGLEKDDTPNPYRHSTFGPWAEDLVRSMTPDSRWINAPDGQYWMNGTNDQPVRIISDEMNTVLWNKFGINESDKFSKYLVNAMRYHARTIGERVTLHEFAVYQRKENRMVVDMGQGNVAILDGKGVDLDRNGAHGVLFRAGKFQEAWEYQPNHGSPLVGLVESINFEKSDVSPLTKNDQRWLLRLYIHALFFGSVMPAKPIAVATGLWQSGKSTMFRLIGRILVGPEWNLKKADEEKQSDFWVAVTSNFIAGWDNVDRGVKWLEDALCTASDGVPITKRILHTTNEEGVFKPNCFMQITSRTPEFRRRDVASRALIFNLAQRATGAEEGEDLEQQGDAGEFDLYEALAKDRAAYMSELLDVANKTIAVPEQDGSDSPIRNTDFWRVCKRTAVALGLDMDKLRGLFYRVKRAQDGFATDENPIVMAAQIWLERSRAGGHLNSGYEITSSQLYQELLSIANSHKFDLEVASDRAFGRALNELAAGGGLAEHFEFEDLERKGGKGRVVRLTRYGDEDSQ